MKKTSALTVTLFGICAVIWTIRAIQEIIYQTYNESVFWFVLNVLCGVIWTLGFVLHLKRYRSNKDK